MIRHMFILAGILTQLCFSDFNGSQINFGYYYAGVDNPQAVSYAYVSESLEFEPGSLFFSGVYCDLDPYSNQLTMGGASVNIPGTGSFNGFILKILDGPNIQDVSIRSNECTFFPPDISFYSDRILIRLDQRSCPEDVWFVLDISFETCSCFDCDDDGICDFVEIEQGSAADFNLNGIDDNCDPDCDGDGVPDFQAISSGDFDCDRDSIPDSCQVSDDPSLDLNSNTFIDDCEIDCNQNAVFDFIDLYTGVSQDINDNNVPDECEDCDGDGIPDDSDSDPDCDQNGIPDTCEKIEDCNSNGTPDVCESLPDCNQNGTPDECDIAEGSDSDLNQDNIPDSCQCIADVVPSGEIEFSDLITLLSKWGPCESPCPSDIIADGDVGFSDLLYLLSNWGKCSNDPEDDGGNNPF